jgi:hypothetical protein
MRMFDTLDGSQGLRTIRAALARHAGDKMPWIGTRRDGIFPNWRVMADEDGHYCFVVAP